MLPRSLLLVLLEVLLCCTEELCSRCSSLCAEVYLGSGRATFRKRVCVESHLSQHVLNSLSLSPHCLKVLFLQSPKTKADVSVRKQRKQQLALK